MRGGVSALAWNGSVFVAFSPRAWRCFRFPRAECRRMGVFSTCVEVFPTFGLVPSCSASFLHVRGGVSYRRSSRLSRDRFSPRAWRCFYPEPGLIDHH